MFYFIVLFYYILVKFNSVFCSFCGVLGSTLVFITFCSFIEWYVLLCCVLVYCVEFHSMLFFVLHFVLCYILFFSGVLSSILLLFFYSVLWFVKLYSIVFYSSVLSCILFYSFPLWWGKFYYLFCFVVCWVEFYCIVFSLILLSYSIELCSYLLFCGVLSYIVLTCVLFYCCCFFWYVEICSIFSVLFFCDELSSIWFCDLFLSVPLLCGKKKSILFYYIVEFYSMFFFGLLWWVIFFFILLCSLLFCWVVFYSLSRQFYVFQNIEKHRNSWRDKREPHKS